MPTNRMSPLGTTPAAFPQNKFQTKPRSWVWKWALITNIARTKATTTSKRRIKEDTLHVRNLSKNVKTSTHVRQHLLELNGVSFEGKDIVIEETESKQKAKIAIISPQNKNDQSHQPVDFNIQKKLYQKKFQKPTQNIVHTYLDTIKARKMENVLLTDSIPKSINM